MILVSKNNDHVVLSSEEISIGVDDTSFPNTMRIRVESKNKLSDFNWGFAATLGNLHKTVNICVHLNCYVSTSSFPKRGLLKYTFYSSVFPFLVRLSRPYNMWKTEKMLQLFAFGRKILLPAALQSALNLISSLFC